MALELPTQYAGEQAGLDRRRKLADALMAQSMAPMQSRQAGRFVVAPSPLEGIGKLVQALAANRMQSGVESGQTALGQKVSADRQTRLQQALQTAQGSSQPSAELGGGPAMPGDPMGAYAHLAASGDPVLMSSGTNMMNLQARQADRQQQQSFLTQQKEEERRFREAEAAKQRDMQRELVQLRADVGGDRPYYQFLQTPEGYVAGNARSGQVTPVLQDGKPVMPSQSSVPLQGNLAEAKAGGKERGEAQAQAQIDLPRVINNANNSLGLIDQMVGSEDGKTKQHPGFQSSVGLGARMLGAGYIPGSDTSNFGALLDQVKGGAFLEAFNSLKGGGQITEIEGKKATDAITRMSNAQSEKEFIKAAREYQGIIKLGVQRAQQKAGSRGDGPERRGVPAGIDPALWEVMTPQERAAWSR